MSLRQAVSAPGSKRNWTRRVFATIADRYDRVNVVLSFNRDRRWKRRLVARADPRPGEVAADLACGTGDLAFLIAQGGARVVGLDITPRMIALARAKAAGATAPSASRPAPAGRVEFLIGDMAALPFDAGSFDLVTTGYGLRNVPDIGGSLGEILRVLKPGGRFFSLDFNRPASGLVRALYLAYLGAAGSAIGWALHRDPDMYRYIAETVRLHPGGAALAALLASAGFAGARYEPVFGGFMAMHSATKPR